MIVDDRFPPTLDAALVRIAAVRPRDYPRTRNAIDGAVSRLSPYLTHGFVTLADVLAGVAARHPLGVQHKFVFELGWREYFHHVWQHRGDDIFESLHEGVLPDDAYARELPPDIREARTGVPVIDASVRALYASGYLHNHARMWLASYIVHLRKIHWRVGADWLHAHLLDGDLASNHLSWQWIAGSGSRKPYLFNAENVARYAPADWHSPGSVIDTSYQALDEIARSPCAVVAQPGSNGIEEPSLHREPPMTAFGSWPDAGAVAGRDVWLVHPWALRAAPADLPADCVQVGVMLYEFHHQWPWSAARWTFVRSRFEELTSIRWFADANAIASALRGARSVRSVANPHVGSALDGIVTFDREPKLFADVDKPCTSFAKWWTLSTRAVLALDELPGLASRSSFMASEPGFAPGNSFSPQRTPHEHPDRLVGDALARRTGNRRPRRHRS